MFCRIICFVAIYTFLCGEKLSHNLTHEEKLTNMRYSRPLHSVLSWPLANQSAKRKHPLDFSEKSKEPSMVLAFLEKSAMGCIQTKCTSDRDEKKRRPSGERLVKENRDLVNDQQEELEREK